MYLESLKLLRFIGTGIFSNRIALYQGVTEGDNSEIQKVAFRKEKRHGTRNLENDLFLGHLQPPEEKNSEDLAILILELDDNLVIVDKREV